MGKRRREPPAASPRSTSTGHQPCPGAVGWKQGEAPVVAAGLKVQAIATGLLPPRIVYASNGDILVVERNGPASVPFRPKDFIQGKVKARGGAAAKGGNQLTPCWATRTATDCRSREPCSSITSTRPMAWPTSATPSMSPTPTATRHLQKRARPPRWPRQVGRDGRASAERRSQVPVVCRGQSCLSYSRR